MLILIIARNLPTLKYLTHGIFEFDQAKALKSYDHKVVLVSLDLRSFRRKRRLGKYWSVKEDIPVLNISLPLGGIPKRMKNTIGRWYLGLHCNDILINYGKPDIIHAHFYEVGYMAAALKNKFKVPLIITEHSSDMNKQVIDCSLKCIARKSYQNADQLITVSTRLQKNIIKHLNINSQVVPNVLDKKIFNYSIENKRKPFKFIAVGSLTQNKGFDLLINAFKNAGLENRVILSIVGVGPEEKALKLLVLTLGLGAQVKFLGLLEREKISKLMQDSDAFVLASHSETFGVVYIEALSMGLPVIATACGGPEDFITAENGILVPANDLDQLVFALKKMVEDIDKYDKKNIAESASNKFSPETISAILTDIYIKTINEQKK